MMAWGEAVQKKRFASRFEGQFDKGKMADGVEVYTEASSWAEYKGQFKDDKWHNEGTSHSCFPFCCHVGGRRPEFLACLYA